MEQTIKAQSIEEAKMFYNTGIYTFSQLLKEVSAEEQRSLVAAKIEKEFAKLHQTIDETKQRLLKELLE